MSARVLRGYPYVLAGAACFGLSAANGLRLGSPLMALIAAAAAVAGALSSQPAARVALIGLALLSGGWWWGSVRLDAIDASALLDHVGEEAPAVAVVTGPARAATFELRVPATLRRFGAIRLDEPVLLQLPLGRSPPQGALVALDARIRLPRPPAHGFDERTWLRRHGVHVVVSARGWTAIGRRGGLGRYADRVRDWLARWSARSLGGERRAVLEGVVLGEDQDLSDGLRTSFRASGLYHLLAVSGQNVAFVAGGVLGLAWLLGIPRRLGELGALAGIGSYVLAVGAQPSVVRAGIAGALGSLAWLAARQRDRWHFLLVGALALLGWNPYTLLDAGFELSFAAVVAIFLLVPRLRGIFAGYPVPRALGDVVAVSLACGVATAPILLLQFGRIPLYTVPANAIVAPVVGPLLGLALAAAAVGPLSPPASAAIAWLNGWLAAYVAACARAIAGLPGSTVSSTRGLLALAAGASALVSLLVYACSRRVEA